MLHALSECVAFDGALTIEVRPVMQGSGDNNALVVGIDIGANATNMKTVGSGRAPERERGTQRGKERAMTVGKSNACVTWNFNGQTEKFKRKKSQTR
jgi:hypothetical protein